MAKQDGTIFFAAATGREAANDRDLEIWQEPTDTLDNDKATNPHYYVWPTVPGRQFEHPDGTRSSRVPVFRPSNYSGDDHNLIEAPLREPPEGKGRALGHVFMGELGYVGIIPNSTFTAETSAGDLYVKFQRLDAHSREPQGHVVVNGIGQRNTDTGDGGVEADVQMRKGERNLYAATDRVPMGVTDVMVDHCRIQVDDGV
jgi:hypothetical protein